MWNEMANSYSKLTDETLAMSKCLEIFILEVNIVERTHTNGVKACG
jgi:hypothetical protein